MSQQDHTHWWRDGDASAAPSSLQIGHHQAVVSPVRDECCAGAAGRSPRRTDSKEQQHEPATWMSRRLVSTAVLTSGMTASACVSEGINRAGYPVREPTRATLVSATWPGGVFLLRPTLRARVAVPRAAAAVSTRNFLRGVHEPSGIFRFRALAAPERRAVSKLAAFHYVTSS